MEQDPEMKVGLPGMTAELSFVILYGSQLGQAKSLAEGLFDIASEHELTSQVFSLNQVKDVADLRKLNIPIVIITSTTGDGEPPESADKFFRKLRKKNLDSQTLHSVRYSILGLGDTNYSKITFATVGRLCIKDFKSLEPPSFILQLGRTTQLGVTRGMEPIFVRYPRDLSRVTAGGGDCDEDDDSESDIMDTSDTTTIPRNELSKEYLDDKKSMLENFECWNQEEQLDFVQSLLLRGSEYLHQQTRQFITSALRRDFITLLPKNGLDHIVDTIFSYLDDESLSAAQLVSKGWCQSIADGMQWKKLVERCVVQDKIWRQLAWRQKFMRHLFRPPPGTTQRKHSYYRALYYKTVDDIGWIERKWIQGEPSSRRLNFRSDQVLDPSQQGVYCLQYDDEKIVAGLRDNTVTVWDLDTLQSQLVLTGHTGSVLCLQYDGQVIISGSSDSTIRVWEVRTGKLLNTLIHHTEAILHLKFKDGTLICCSKDRTISVWKMVSPKEITLRRVLLGHTAAVNVVDFDEKYIVTASGDRTIKVWDTKLCEYRRTLKGHRKGIACLQYNGNILISGGSDFTIRLWDIETAVCLKILVGHTSLVRCLRFDDKRLISGDYDGNIKVWDMVRVLDHRLPGTSDCLFTLSNHFGRIFRLQFDDFLIIAGSHDDAILLFDFGPPTHSWDTNTQDQIIEDWIEGLWSAIKAAIGIVDAVSAGDHVDMESRPLLPSCPQPFIEVTFLDASESTPMVDLLAPPAAYPSIDGQPHVAKLSKAKVLTKGGSVKTTLEVTVEMAKGTEFDFEPGDAIGIVCPNPASEVSALLERLEVKDKEHQVVELTLKSGAKGKIPLHLPRRSTLRDLFSHFLDIRTAPKKAFLRLLAEATVNAEQKAMLLELCSKEGGVKYEETIRFPSVSILDILLKFPSCQPRFESLLEHLPRLIPRAYSIASSPFASKTSFTVAFNIAQIPEGEGRMYNRLGLCTGWLHEMSRTKGILDEIQVDDLVRSLGAVSLAESDKCLGSTEIVFYKRKNHFFRLPTDVSAPIIMVGPGTGVAPFIGFIEHREQQKIQGAQAGPMTLYFGCRHKEKDFLYRNKLEGSKASGSGVLDQLHVSFSRDPDQDGIKYVQDLMERNAAAVVTTLLDQGGYLYVCGDAKNMAKSVRDKLISLIGKVKGFSEKEATDKVSELVTSKRYLQDIWT